jgi:non-specific serine/threonine protein kinase
LELAAARLNVLTPGELLERLDDRFGLLVGGARDQLPRQQTLTATIDWSYQLLTDGERLLFGRLSVFSGGFTLDAIEAVCAGDGVASDRTLDLVSGLIDKSLVLVDHGRAGSRFSLLETMREYAAAKLAVTSEEDERRQAHAGFYRRLAVDSFDELWGPREVGWLDRLEDEWPNMRRALAWHVDNTAQDGLLMAGSLYRFGFRRHYVPEIRAWLERFLDADPTPSSARARALNGMGTLSDQRHYFDEAISLYREYGPTGELAIVLQNAGYNKMNTGDWESARAMIAEAVDLPTRRIPGCQCS